LRSAATECARAANSTLDAICAHGAQSAHTSKRFISLASTCYSDSSKGCQAESTLNASILRFIKIGSEAHRRCTTAGLAIPRAATWTSGDRAAGLWTAGIGRRGQPGRLPTAQCSRRCPQLIVYFRERRVRSQRTKPPVGPIWDKPGHARRRCYGCCEEASISRRRRSHRRFRRR